jgi:hypothetical protein
MAIDATHGGVGQPANNAVLVSPHDDNDLEHVSRALYVGGTGNVVVIMLGGETVTFSGVPAGAILPIRVSRVKATDTTATLILSLR